MDRKAPKGIVLHPIDKQINRLISRKGRRAICLPAVVATRFNPDMKAKYEQLISTGKRKKLAVTAIMRKRIVTANALLRDQRK